MAAWLTGAKKTDLDVPMSEAIMEPCATASGEALTAKP